VIFLETGFVYAARTTEIETGKTRKVAIGEAEILIVNADDKIYAIDSLCTHYGGDLSEGTLQGRILTCPVHGAKFDVTDGKVVSPPTEPLDRPDIENLTTYPVRIENQNIYIKIN
jgi:nitrite reductase/ring-hydroxylating ferredoxin subunit